MAANPKLCKALEHLIDRWGPIEGRTRLMKLIYLADLEWAGTHSGPYTEATYYRWNHGPFSREVLKAIAWMDGIEIVQGPVSWDRGDTDCYRSGASTRLGEVRLDPDFLAILDRIGSHWKTRPLNELLEHVYGGDGFKDREFGEHLF